MKVTALICVAMTDRPTAHQRICRPARKKSSIFLLPRPAHMPKETIATMYTPRTTQSSVVIDQ
jgi:hypothetical protein